MPMVLLIFIVLLPVALWFYLWRLQDKEKEPLHAMLWCFFLGIVASLPFFFLRWWGIESGSSSLSVFFFAFLEEVVKALLLVLAIEISRHWFTQIVDGLIYGSALALGFAFAENVFYLMDLALLTPNPLQGEMTSLLNIHFISVYFVRSLDTMLGHTLFTALFGFFYASAYLRKEIFPNKKKEKPWYHFRFNLWEALPLHVTLFHILPNRPSNHGHYPGSLILEGILVASGLHGIFNVLHGLSFGDTSLGFLTVPFIFGIAYLLWRKFFQAIYIKVVRRVKG